MQQKHSCERTQHKILMTGLGSSWSLAAAVSNDRFGPDTYVLLPFVGNFAKGAFCAELTSVTSPKWTFCFTDPKRKVENALFMKSASAKQCAIPSDHLRTYT